MSDIGGMRNVGAKRVIRFEKRRAEAVARRVPSGGRAGRFLRQ